MVTWKRAVEVPQMKHDGTNGVESPCELFAQGMSTEQAPELTPPSEFREVCFCVYAQAEAFYLCQDPASAVSGELVCGALGELEHEKPLFAVWLQHTNIREASLECRNVDLTRRPKGTVPRTLGRANTQRFPVSLSSDESLDLCASESYDGLK